MSGDIREWNYPILSNGIKKAVTNKEKAELMVNAFVSIHSSKNLSEEGRKGRESTKSKNLEALRRKEISEDEQNCPN